MNNKVMCALAFVVGAATGSVVTWKIVETKYKRIAQEEIDSVKETFTVRRTETGIVDIEDCDLEVEGSVSEIVDYNKVLNNTNYGDISNEKEGEEDMCKPYVISPEEFDEHDDYQTSSLTYYADGVLEDDFGEVIEDVDALVGRESLTHFGEYEDDSVYVRNDELKIDYEILLDLRKYSDIRKRPPHSGGD